MNTDTVSLVSIAAVVAAALSALVGFVSLRIVRRQEQMIARLQDTAGVRGVEAVEPSMPNALAHLLRQVSPKRRIRILSASGAALIASGEVELQRLVHRGVEVEVLLLNPDTQNVLFAEKPSLVSQVRAATESLQRIDRDGAVTIRYYDQPLLESMIFIDDADLWLAPALPLVTTRPLMYHIVNGPKSLYRLYEGGFEFLWSHSLPAQTAA